jgi:hypothetical protein
MLAALLALLLSASGAGLSPQPPLLTAEGSSLGADGKTLTDLPFLAVSVDVGVPDGIGASLVVMPVSFLRIHLGGLTNGVGAGVRLGATLLAFPTWPVRPLLAVDAGYVFGGHAPWVLEYVSDPSLRAALSQVSAGFLNAHAGLELGGRNVALVLRGGVSWIDLDLGAQAVDLGGGVTVTANSSSVRGFIPSARIGLMISFG